MSGSKISGDGEVRLTGIGASSSGLQQTGSSINLSGSDTVIEGGNVTISAGAGMNINMDDMAPGAINSAGGVTLAAGPGGSISMQGATGVISATKVTLAADQVETGGTDLNAIVGSNLEKLPAQVLERVSFSQPNTLATSPGQAFTTTLTLYNDSPSVSTYIFTATMDNQSWTLSGLPSTQVISDYTATDLELIIKPPSGAALGETTNITLTAQSKEKPNLTALTSFGIRLEEVVPSTQATLPTTNPTPTPTDVYTQTGTTQKIYLPLVLQK